MKTRINTFRKNQKGIINLTFALFGLMIIVLMIGLLETRVLFSVKRTKGIADSITSTYAAESEIYDYVARIQEGYVTNIESKKVTLPDGTVLTTEKKDNGAIDITAQLPYATTKLELSDSNSSSSDTKENYAKMDIILALDCTGSMANGSGNGKTTRLEELKKATIEFLNNIKTAQQKGDSAPISIGVSMFAADAKWLKIPGGVEISPQNNVPIEQIILTVQSGFKKTPDESPACQTIFDGGTSQASALQFMHNYFQKTKIDGTKQVELVVTDGEPTTAIPIPACGTDYFVPNSSKDTKVCPNYRPSYDPTAVWKCKNYKGDYAAGGDDSTYKAKIKSQQNFACMSADTSTKANGLFGQRDPSIDEFVVLTYKLDAKSPIKTDFPTYPGVNVYDMGNADELSATLNGGVLTTILQKAKELNIRRVIP